MQAKQTSLLQGDYLKNRGQVSFEALFITLIVLTSAMFIASLYLQTHDVTVATIITRTDFLQQINSMEEKVTLNEVRVRTINNNGVLEAEVSVYTRPVTITINDFDSNKITKTIDKIVMSTKFNSVEFKINSD